MEDEKSNFDLSPEEAEKINTFVKGVAEVTDMLMGKVQSIQDGLTKEEAVQWAGAWKESEAQSYVDKMKEDFARLEKKMKNY